MTLTNRFGNQSLTRKPSILHTIKKAQFRINCALDIMQYKLVILSI